MIKDEIISIYHENQGRYGYQRITQELHNRNYCINHKAVQRLMKELHLKCMVDRAFSTLPDSTNLIFHSDQGWQYQHKQYQKRLSEKGIRQSMSRKGNCLDNAVMENFFRLTEIRTYLFKKILLY